VNNIYPQRYQQWQEAAIDYLQPYQAQDPYANPKADVRLLLQFVTGCDRATLLAFPERLLDEKQISTLSQLLARRAKGEPMAYILGEQAFWSLNLQVSERTLIPRPDTEVLVEQALAAAKQRLISPHFDGELAILDLGTGTGAIALALAAELTPLTEQRGVGLTVLGVDVIVEAVALAAGNAERNRVKNTHFIQSHWFEEIGHRHFDLIVANPPYIDAQDEHLRRGDVRFEPLSALVAGQQGYEDLRKIIRQAPQYLKTNGWLLLEHGWQQGEKVRSFFASDLWQAVASVRDYGDNERVTFGRIAKG